MLAKARHFPPTELKSMYHALFSSHIKYGSQIWGQENDTSVNKVFLLQKDSLRIITFSDFRAHTNPLLETKIIKLKDSITLENFLFVYDFLRNRLPRCFNNYFKTLKEVYSTGVRTRNSEYGCLYLRPTSKSIRFR